MKEFKQVEIDGREYFITCLTTSKQLKIATLITKLSIPSMAAGMAGADMSSLVALKDSVSIPSAMAALADRIEEDKVLEAIQMLAGCAARVDKQPTTFDTYWAGELAHLFKVLGAVMEVNYGDFFAVLKDKVGGLLTALEAVSKPSAATPSNQEP